MTIYRMHRDYFEDLSRITIEHRYDDHIAKSCVNVANRRNFSHNFVYVGAIDLARNHIHRFVFCRLFVCLITWITFCARVMIKRMHMTRVYLVKSICHMFVCMFDWFLGEVYIQRMARRKSKQIYVYLGSAIWWPQYYILRKQKLDNICYIL